jgi:hypothetical protein
MKPDDWEKRRTNGQCLNADEVRIVEDGYRIGRSAREVARDLKCATRTINARYDRMRGGPSRRTRGPGNTVAKETRPSPEALAELAARRPPQTITAALFGDPAPGRSALDQHSRRLGDRTIVARDTPPS